MGEKHVRHPWFKTFMIAFLALLYAALFLGCGYFYKEIYPKAAKTADSIEFHSWKDQQASTLYYNNNGHWEVYNTLYSGENRKYVESKDIPENLKNAAIAVEDKRFYEHHGVDWFRTASAAVHSVVNKVTGESMMQGGSTITQQLIKNLTGHDDVSVKRKANEIIEALLLETRYSKDDILTEYLNDIYFGRECYGVYMASYKYFGKPVQDLDLAECAVLISITNNPSVYDPYIYPEKVFARGRKVLMDMYGQGMISRKEEQEALACIGYTIDTSDHAVFHEDMVTMKFMDKSLTAQVADGTVKADCVYDWFTDAMIESLTSDFMQQGYSREDAQNMIFEGGLKIYMTVQPDVQQKAQTVYETTAYKDRKSASGAPLKSGITIIDNKTGAVAATVGEFGKKSESRLFSCASDMQRQPASSIKPLSVYAPALDSGLVTPESYQTDEPVKDGWPQNADGRYRGQVTIEQAVVNSWNTVPVRLLDEIGVNTSVDWLNKFGIPVADSDKSEAPLALGGMTYGVSPEEMAGAYTAFADDGFFVKPYYYEKVEDADGNVLFQHAEKQRIMKPETAKMMRQMLRKVAKDGTGRAAWFDSQDVAVKTGTSNDWADHWCCGLTGYYTAAVWSGYDTKEPAVTADDRTNVSAALWKEVMTSVLAAKPYLSIDGD